MEKCSYRHIQWNAIDRGTHWENKVKIKLPETFTIYLSLVFNLVSILKNSNVYICNNN